VEFWLIALDVFEAKLQKQGNFSSSTACISRARLDYVHCAFHCVTEKVGVSRPWGLPAILSGARTGVAGSKRGKNHLGGSLSTVCRLISSVNQWL